MLKLFGLQFNFENLFIITCIIASIILILNLSFFIYLIIKRFRKKKPKINFLDRETNGHKLVRFKSDLASTTPKKNFKEKLFSFFAAIKTKSFYSNFFKSLVKIKTYKFLLSPRFWLFTFTFLGIIFIYQSVMLMFHGHPDVIGRYPLAEETWNDPRKPIIVEFDRPIDIKKLKFSLVPELEGEIKYEKSFEQLPFTRKVYFYPKTTLEPGYTMYNYVSGIHALLNNEPRYDHEVYFQGYKSPEVKTTSVKENAEDVLVNEIFQFELNQDYDEFTDFDFEFSPPIEFEKKIEGNKIILTPKNTFAQSASYKLSAYRTTKILNLDTNEIITKLPRETIKEIPFTTVKAPQIKSFAPIGNAVFVDSEIKIEFSKEMFPETVMSKLAISPAFEYTPEWSQNNSVLTLKRTANLDYGKEFEIKIAAGAQGKGNTLLETDFSYKFTTIGEVKVLNVSPGNGAGGIGIQNQIRITFDQEVDKNSAQSKFSINPGIGTSFAWEGNTMVVKPNGNYAYQTKYSYTISSGIKSIKGQNSSRSFTYSFTTKSQTVSLGVPLYRQSPYAFGCNVTAASMVMAYKGKSASNVQIYNSLPKSGPTTKDGNTWGDPDAGFVGSLSSNGYGVHWTPISNYLNSQGVGNQVRRGMTASQLAKELEAGRPAIVWWWNQINKASNGGPIYQSWTTPGGKQVNTIVGMHSEVVIGFNGSADNPTSFILNDPRGSRRTISVGTFNYLWGFFGNTAIVVN